MEQVFEKFESEKKCFYAYGQARGKIVDILTSLFSLHGGVNLEISIGTIKFDNRQRKKKKKQEMRALSKIIKKRFIFFEVYKVIGWSSIKKFENNVRQQLMRPP